MHAYVDHIELVNNIFLNNFDESNNKFKTIIHYILIIYDIFITLFFLLYILHIIVITIIIKIRYSISNQNVPFNSAVILNYNKNRY